MLRVLGALIRVNILYRNYLAVEYVRVAFTGIDGPLAQVQVAQTPGAYDIQVFPARVEQHNGAAGGMQTPGGAGSDGADQLFKR